MWCVDLLSCVVAAEFGDGEKNDNKRTAGSGQPKHLDDTFAGINIKRKF